MKMITDGKRLGQIVSRCSQLVLLDHHLFTHSIQVSWLYTIDVCFNVPFDWEAHIRKWDGQARSFNRQLRITNTLLYWDLF